MPRVFFTGKKKIPRNRVSITLLPGQPPEFSATVDLSTYRRTLPEDASVVIEAYHNTMVQRFDFGTRSDPRAREELRLTGFDEWDQPRFRVLVIDQKRHPGMLLASCESINAVVSGEDAEGGRSMLKLVPKPDDEMQGEFWRLKEIGGGYQLWYNKDVRSVASGITSKKPEILGHILPAAIREILSRKILWGEEQAIAASDDDEWIRFAEDLSGESAPAVSGDAQSPDEEEQEAWIDRVVARFCRGRARFVQRVLEQQEAM